MAARKQMAPRSVGVLPADHGMSMIRRERTVHGLLMGNAGGRPRSLCPDAGA
jgi:hypothetical protein